MTNGRQVAAPTDNQKSLPSETLRRGRNLRSATGLDSRLRGNDERAAGLAGGRLPPLQAENLVWDATCVPPKGWIPALAGMTGGDFRLHGNDGILTRATRQRGQSLVEVTLSLLLVLIPLFVFNWFLNAHYNARTDTLAAARYAAWERTVWLEGTDTKKGGATKSQEEIENLMVERIFLKNDDAIKSSTDSEKVKNANRSSFTGLHGYDGEGEETRSKNLLELEETGDTEGKGKRPTLTLKEQSTATSKRNVEAAEAIAVAALTREKPQLEGKGIYVAEVKLKVNPFTSQLQSSLDKDEDRVVTDLDLTEMTNVTYTQKVAVLTDSWSAAGAGNWKNPAPRTEAARVQPMNVGAGTLGTAAKTVQEGLWMFLWVYEIPIFMGGSLPKEPEWGLLKPDLVPYENESTDEDENTNARRPNDD